MRRMDRRFVDAEIVGTFTRQMKKIATPARPGDAFGRAIRDDTSAIHKMSNDIGNVYCSLVVRHATTPDCGASETVANFSGCGMMNSTPSVNRYRKEAERVRELAHTAASD